LRLTYFVNKSISLG